MRHPGTYLGLPMPDPTSSESGKGTRGSPAPTLGLTGSGSRLRALQCDCSTMVCSPSGEHHPLVSRRVTAPLLRSVATPVASLARVETEAGKEMNEARVCGEPAARRFCSRKNRSPPSIADGRLTAFWAELGPGGRRVSRPRPSLRSKNSTRAGTGRLWFSGPVSV
jgi:hypothetical protein